LDPSLVLSGVGLQLIRRLGEFMELWMPRELWHILDNSQFYLSQPESLFLLADDEKRITLRRERIRDEIVAAIKVWEHIRMESDLSGLKVFWIGDGLSESLVPAGTGPDLVWRYELLARALDRQLTNSRPIACIARDTAALAAALGTALILTYRTTEDVEAGATPQICKALGDSVPCELLPDGEPLAAIEREYMRHLLVYSGMANLLWSGLHLAVLHFAVPAAVTLYGAPQRILTNDLPELEAALPVAADSLENLWQGARAFWYQL
jgi:hypothetical protein